MKKLLLLVTLTCLLFSAACGKKNGGISETETAAQTGEPSVTQTSFIETSAPAAETTVPATKPETTLEPTTQNTTTNETTSETTAEKLILSDFFIMPEGGSRPVAVMIDNEGTNSYPQGGIEKAQIVYEMIAEWGETRLIPVFYNIDKGNIGPVRSLRHYMIQFAMEYDPVLVHVGYSPQAESMLKKNNLANVNGLYYSVFFDITNDPKNWQDTYTEFGRLNRYISTLDYRKEASKQFPFSYGSVALKGVKAESIRIEYSRYYSTGFEYDPATGLYARLRKGEHHIERYTGEVLAARNIIIQKVRTYPIKNDTSGRMTMDNIGSGRGYFITSGSCADITWEKNSDFAQTIYRYADTGEKIVLNEGQTWIMVVDEDPKLVIS